MISLEQIQLLESRVMKAVRRIETLQSENDTLRERLGRYEKRIQELEVLINEFKDGQSEIEQGIMNALSQLDNLEDQVTDSEIGAGPELGSENSQAGNSSSSDSEQTPATAQKSSHEVERSRGPDHPPRSGDAAQENQQGRAGTSQKNNGSRPGGSQETPTKNDQPPEADTEVDRSKDTNTNEAQSTGGVSDDEHDTDSHRSSELDIF